MRFRLVTIVGCVLMASSLAFVPPQVIDAATVPPGFTDTFVASFDSPTAVEWLPSSKIAVLEQTTGRVLVGEPGGAFVIALELAVCAESERGLLGLTVDPAFLGNQRVYIYYTAIEAEGCMNRVSRFTFAGDVIDPNSEQVLLDNIPATGGSHNGGDLDIDGAGNLLVSIGDAGRDPRGVTGKGGDNEAAQDLSLLSGKIVRITLDGRPAPGNPFSGIGTSRCALLGVDAPTSSRCQEIYAWGLRNPYRIAVDRNDGAGTFFINDVGENTFEEINLGVAGADYGWPDREGPCPQGETRPCPATSHTAPITTYGRDAGSYITAGAFVPDGLWPARFDHDYLFGDGGSGNIWVRTRGGQVDFDAPFATGAFGLTDMTFGFGSDGVLVLYYVQIGGGLRMIRPEGVTRSPVVAGLKIVPITPSRAFDSADGAGSGRVHNGTTRQIVLSPPAGTSGALVNLTYDATTGPGFVRTWASRSARPAASALNADAANTVAANANIVALGADGSFVLESTTSARVVVDVMAWLIPSDGGTSNEGRFENVEQLRVFDTRLPVGETLNPAYSNNYRRSPDRIDFDVLGGQLSLPDDGTVGSIVVSVAAIGRQDVGGFVGGHAGGTSYPGTSNVNVVPGDVRANMVVIPIGVDVDASLTTVGIADVAVDILGYITTSAAPRTKGGLIRLFAPSRLIDTRDGRFCARLTRDEPCWVQIGGPGNDMSPYPTTTGGVFQNVTVTRTAGPGYLTVDSRQKVSSVNFTGPLQTRAALTFASYSRLLTPTPYRSSAETDLVIDHFAIVQPSWP